MATPTSNTTAFEIVKCKSCKGNIIWARTVNGKWIPVDAIPSDAGQVTLQEPGPDDEAPLAMYHTVKGRGVTYYVPHFATCPHGKHWRKKHVGHND